MRQRAEMVTAFPDTASPSVGVVIPNMSVGSPSSNWPRRRAIKPCVCPPSSARKRSMCSKSSELAGTCCSPPWDTPWILARMRSWLSSAARNSMNACRLRSSVVGASDSRRNTSPGHDRTRPPSTCSRTLPHCVVRDVVAEHRRCVSRSCSGAIDAQGQCIVEQCTREACAQSIHLDTPCPWTSAYLTWDEIAAHAPAQDWRSSCPSISLVWSSEPQNASRTLGSG